MKMVEKENKNLEIFRSRKLERMAQNAYISVLLDSGRAIDKTRAESYKECEKFARRIDDEIEGTEMKLLKTHKVIQGIDKEHYIFYRKQKVAMITPRNHSLNGYIIWDTILTDDGYKDTQNWVGRNYDEKEQDRTLQAIQEACNDVDEILNQKEA